LQLVQKIIKFNSKSIRLYNSSENKSFHQLIIKSATNINFEFTASGTPQKNGKVERAFASLFGKTRSMLNAGTIPLIKGLRAKCANVSAQLENIIVKENYQQYSSEKVYGTSPKWISNMRTFGEMAIIARH
jgi:hypothetical protein